MADKKNKMSDKEILVKVDSKVRQCVGWYDSKLSKERERVLKYYNGELPKRQHEGSSAYIATDVYDAVETLKGQLLETFAGNDYDILKFNPNDENDVEKAKEATIYTNYVIFRQNQGYKVFHDVIHDGLTARIGIAKVYWDKRDEFLEESFDSVSELDLQSLVVQEDIDTLNAEETEEGSGLYSGTLRRKVDLSQVVIEPLPPEEVLVEPRAKCLDKALCVSHKSLKTRAELYDMGFPKKLVDSIHWDDDKGLDLGPEVLARNNPIASANAYNDAIQDELQKVTLYETYVRMDIGDGKGVVLWKFLHAGDVLFDKQEVDRIPFFAFVPLPQPHTIYGQNFGARAIPFQNARTVLTRGILDHTAITTNPRWQVVKGGVLNPREMLENRLGGVVNVTRPDAIQPFPYANLNPFVFETLRLLQEDREQTTGISSLATGLNKDAVAKQNSADLVDNLVNLSSQRQKIMARNFADQFLIPLFLEVYRLVLENEDKQKIIEVAGSFVQVNPKDWIERKDVVISLQLGYGEREKEAAKHAQMAQLLNSNPRLQHMITDENQYNLTVDGLKKAGYLNYNSYITPPTKVQPPGPDPLKMKELEIKDKQAQAALITAQANAEKAQMVAQMDAMRVELDRMKFMLDQMNSEREHARLDIETANRVDVAQREMTLAENMPDPDRRGIVSPNG